MQSPLELDLIVFGLLFMTVACDEGPLTFDYYDKLNGKQVFISEKTGNAFGQIKKVEYKLAKQETSIVKAINNDDWKEFVSSSGTGRPLSYQWTKPDGICAEYDVRTAYDNGRTLVQHLDLPPLRLANLRLRTTSLQYDNTSNLVTLKVAWGTDLDYWKFISIDTWLSKASCATLFSNYPPPPEILEGGHLLNFHQQYAYSNCTFVYGLNVSVELANGLCVRNLSTSNQDSLSINFNCYNVPKLICPLPMRICPLDCRPMEVKGVKENNDSNEEYLKVTWSFQTSPKVTNRAQADPMVYQIRYSEANVSEWNTLFNETESFTIKIKNDFFVLRPKSQSVDVNYTFQICALLDPNCQQQRIDIDWKVEPRYKLEYRATYRQQFPSAPRPPEVTEKYRRPNSRSSSSSVNVALLACVLFFGILY